VAHPLVFGKIHIIEWLWTVHPTTGEPDRRTGKELYDEVVKMVAEAKSSMQVILHRVGSRSAFLKRLRRIEQDFASTSRIPLLHIETHGGSEGIGLDDDGLTWLELMHALTPLNLATGCWLPIFVAACEGAKGTEMAQAMRRAPFYAILGPKREVLPSEIFRGLRAFYRKVVVEADGLKAMDRLNTTIDPDEDTFQIFNCEQLFRKIWDWYLDGKTVDEIMGPVLEEKLAERHAKRPMTDAEIAELREYVSKYAKDYRPRFEESRRHFFMIDLHPRNDARFKLVLEPVAEGSDTLRIAES
jgi:hypothetical protein